MKRLQKGCILYCILVGTLSGIAWAQSDNPPPDLAQLVHILQDETTSEEEWIDAAMQLAGMDTEDARNALVTAFVEVPERAKPAIDALRAIDAQFGWANHLYLAQSEELRNDLRKMVIFGMSEHRVDEARDILLNLTNSKQEEIRCAAIIGLSSLEDSRVVPLLFGMVTHKECSQGYRASAVTRLGKLGGNQTESYLEELIGSDDREVDEAARWALAEYRNRTRQRQEVTVGDIEVTEKTPGSLRCRL